MEIWKTIDEFPNYQVSNLGRVKGPVKLLKPHLDKWGYPTITISFHNKKHTKQIHKFVAKAFISNPLNLPVVDHINRIKTDNRVENLRWTTYSQNCSNRKPCVTNTGLQHISINTKGYYRISFWRNEKQYCTLKNTLEKAIAWRDETLKILSDKEEDGGNQGNILFEEQTPTTRVGEGIPEKE